LNASDQIHLPKGVVSTLAPTVIKSCNNMTLSTTNWTCQKEVVWHNFTHHFVNKLIFNVVRGENNCYFYKTDAWGGN